MAIGKSSEPVVSSSELSKKNSFLMHPNQSFTRSSVYVKYYLPSKSNNPADPDGIDPDDWGWFTDFKARLCDINNNPADPDGIDPDDWGWFTDFKAHR
jgi:hypothetical protein